MKIKKLIIMFLLILPVSSGSSYVFSQNSQQKPSRQSSLDAFLKGNFEQAYLGFSELLKIYSKDPLYKYYCGACLVELKRSPDEALKLMEQALQSATVVKPLPGDARYYLGRAQQISGKYSEAAKSYKLYADEAGKKASRGKGVDDLIQQCKEGKGKIEDIPFTASEKIVKDQVPEVKPEVMPEPAAVLPPATAAVPPAANVVTVTEQKKPLSYEKLIDQGMEFQFLADSLFDLTALQRKDLEKLPEPQKAAIVTKIEENEKKGTSYQQLADQKFAEAKSISSAVQEKPKETAIENKPVVPVVPVTGPVQEKPKEVIAALPPATKPPEENVKNEAAKTVVPEPRTQKPVESPVITKPVVELYSLFEILPGKDQVVKKPSDPEFRMTYTFGGKNWWDADAKISIDPPVPSGLIYRIQIAVFRNPVKPSFFKGLAPVYGFRIEGTDKTIYYAGMFRKLSDAGKALVSVKEKGFADAFIVALSENKKVPSASAAVLEKEWAKKPFISAGEAPGGGKPVLDTIPPTLSFRVEVLKSLKPLKEDAVEGMKKVAGNRGVDIQTVETGITYLIGKFITFESASEYCDLLIKNGYREARVVAFLGAREIPVETAKQLFEK